jgi:hypothetical protein
VKPSEFYRLRRPEYFSDSEMINETVLPREVLAYELSKISTNQKQDEFETLCRRLAEKFIVPNLIPQVGPTGGGDGKTDFETYPVSSSIFDRWFVPENGWDKDEKWAFAISAKEEWKGKAKGDVQKIVETKRDYTRVYFMTNQLVSSKKKKDAQDEFEKEFNVEVIILDGEWILEHIYNNDVTSIAVDSLNLSSTYKNKKERLGANDSSRFKKLEDLEKNISNPNRYFEYDFQLVEDAIETAILSRMLEKPRDEVEGKFDRAFRFCKKINNPRQWIRIYYQRAWTYFNYYNDYPLFVEDYKNLKIYISKDSDISDIELYFNLFNLLNAIPFSTDNNLTDYKIDIENERTEIINILSEFENDYQKPNSALTAKTYKSLLELIYGLTISVNPAKYFRELSDILQESKFCIDYPFESIKQIIEEFGNIFPNDTEYDNLIDNLAEISEKRYSELTSGEIFGKRGGQKLDAKYYKESIVYFGKAVMKLAKEESKDIMCLVLLGLGMAYRELGLVWASNNCYISACSLSFKSIAERGTLNKRIYQSLEEIIKNELFIGRIPLLFTWYEMFSILNRTRNIENEDNDDIPFDVLIDGCLSTRIIHTDAVHAKEIQYLPDLLKKLELYSSFNTALYKLGYVDKIINDYDDIDDEQGLDEFFKKVANQPFAEQMLCKTIFMSEDKLYLSSNIIGCKFIVKFTIEHFVSNIFEKEEVNERLSIIIAHRNFVINLLGEAPKLFFNDWQSYVKPAEYISTRKTPISYDLDIKEAKKEFQKKDMNRIRHDEIKTQSVIDLPLWNEAQWKGFGFLLHPQEGFGIILAYENGDAGIKIFNKWINKIGKEDKSNLIRIAIIKGIDKNNPHWYRVHISANMENEDSLHSKKFFVVVPIFHEMTANSPKNLNNLISLFRSKKEYKLYPARMSTNGKGIEPFYDKSILKTNLTIKDAWEIGENDLDRVVIKKSDVPIIPEGNTNAPILKILNK